MLPQFDLVHTRIFERAITLSTGVYSRLEVKFLFSRNIGFYVIQVYLPSILIVIISWVSFWLSRDATPARVALGVTTVLTMTTLMTTTNSALPKVSYVKSIDIYLMSCFFLVFATLLEYAVVGYLNKRLRMKKETRLQRQNTVVAALTAPSYNSSNAKKQGFGFKKQSKSKRVMYPETEPDENSRLASHGATGWQVRPSSQLNPSLLWSDGASGFSNVECDCDIERGKSSKIKRIKIAPAKKMRNFGMNPSSIDKYSRIVFPVFFLIFNAIYWSVYNHLSGKEKASASGKS